MLFRSNDTATTEIYTTANTLSLHDALPISVELYRPAEDAYYRGQFNGDEITAVPVVGGGTDEPASGEYVTITDDSASISLEVPAAWGQVDGAASTDANGTTWESVSASPDLAGYQGTWSTPGVTVYASQAAAGMAPDAAADLVTADLAAQGCVSEGREPFDDGMHTGVWEIFTGCGGEATYVVVGANDYAGTYATIVAAQAIGDADFDAVDRVLGSFYAAY